MSGSGRISDHQANFMNAVGGGAPPGVIIHLLTAASRGRIDVNATHPTHGVNPLMALTCRPDDEDTVAVAAILLRYGARVDERDTSGPGVTALLMAAQEGKPELLRFLISRGGKIDICGHRSCTQPLVLAAQNRHTECVAVLVTAAKEQNKLAEMIDARNKFGCTAANVAVSRGQSAIVGVLAKAGADLRFACPVYFVDPEGGDSEFDPSPNARVNFALNMAVRSFVTLACVHCGFTTGQRMSNCSRCRMAHYCCVDHQKADWKKHKLVCKKLRQGQDMAFPEEGMPVPKKEPAGFQEADFAECDNTDTSEDYDRESHPVWEYDAGERGTPNWIRYPPRIEEGLENLMFEGSPRYMYRPGNVDATGIYEGGTMSATPPPTVATRYVYWCDMTEREVYRGSARAVRRNGKREFREAEAR